MWNGSEEISAAGLAEKHWLGAAVLSREWPGLGARILGWGAAKLCHSCLVRARHEINSSCAERRKARWQSLREGMNPGPLAERLSQVSLFSAETAGKAARGGSDLHLVAQSRSSRAKHKENLSSGPH